MRAMQMAERRSALTAIYGHDLDAPTHNMLGLSALVAEMAEQGVTAAELFAGTGVAIEQLTDASAWMSHRQKIAIFRNVLRLTHDPAVGLKAGQRQRLSDFGVFGYALASSATFGDAVRFGVQHIRLAGPVLEKTFRIEGDTAIFEGRDIIHLGDLLPLVSEFWFSSVHALASRVLERPFRAYRLYLPYPAPPHAAVYEEVLCCPVQFGAGVMQWHFDARLLDQPLPNANPITADLCTAFCARMLEAFDDAEPELVRAVRLACLNSTGGFPRAEEMAARFHLSLRTLHRRLADAGTGYKEILDGVRRRLAVEYLERTSLSIEEVAERTGFSDASNFRKAFKKWTGQLPGYYR